MIFRCLPGWTGQRWRISLAVSALIALLNPRLAAPAEKHDSEDEWAYSAVQRPALPAVNHKESVRNPIDAFIVSRLDNADLVLNTEASKLALLRRVTFDLTGLAPTPHEQSAFLADESPLAYERLVDRLLASPRFGEHMAQDWLDVVRYAETAGFKHDEIRPNAYRYRDYVIRALNNDLPYDRFVRQQLAGDELEPENPDALVATGYLRLYPEESNASNFRQCRQTILDDVTEVTSLAFMGLTVGCAKCHDHKFDPIAQADFYRLQAFFAPMLPRDDLPLVSRQEQYRHEHRQTEWEEATSDVRLQIEELLEPTSKKAMAEVADVFDPETRAAVLKDEDDRTALEEQLAALASREVQKKMNRLPNYLDDTARRHYESLQKELASYNRLKPAELPLAMGVSDVDEAPPPTYLLATGVYNKPVKEVAPAFIEHLDPQPPEISPPDENPDSTGRRTALARWLVRPDNPLTARVMVNRIWQHHFGRGIVATPNDFGAMGEAPTHPELLDWLASEFVANGWSMKSLHRLIVTSATYRQASRIDPQNPAHQKAQEVDPSNKLLWHARRLRLRGEMIRDVVLQLSGQMSLRMYGPSARPELPPELMSSSRYAWEPDEKPDDRQRRSIFVFAKRNLRHPLLSAFDPPDMINSCARRSMTVTAPQALTMLNGKLLLGEARQWSGRLLAQSGHDQVAFISTAFREAVGRGPSGSEIEEAQQFLCEQAERIAAEGEIAPTLLPQPVPLDMRPAESAARVDFCHALLNASEFVFVE